MTVLADRAASTAGLTIAGDLRERLTVLARDDQTSRYPDAVVSGTPRAGYGPSDSERAAATVADLVTGVDATWASLVAAGETWAGSRRRPP